MTSERIALKNCTAALFTNRQKLETSQMPILMRMDKQMVAHPCNVRYSAKREQTANTCNVVDLEDTGAG